MLNKCITLPEELCSYIKDTNLQLSGFIQDRLWEKIEKEGLQEKYPNYRKRS
jgi:hypothetical protein